MLQDISKIQYIDSVHLLYTKPDSSCASKLWRRQQQSLWVAGITDLGCDIEEIAERWGWMGMKNKKYHMKLIRQVNSWVSELYPHPCPQHTRTHVLPRDTSGYESSNGFERVAWVLYP
jgi:hypothetical protein